MNHKMELYLLTRAFERLAEKEDWQAGLVRKVYSNKCGAHARVDGEPLRIVYVRPSKGSNRATGAPTRRRSKYNL